MTRPRHIPRLLLTAFVALSAATLSAQTPDSFCIAALKPLVDTINWDDERDSCIAIQRRIAIEQAREAWQDSIATLISEYMERQECMTGDFSEELSVSYTTTEHHYTLYYYDQAGNLIQTVPPEGVAPVANSAFNDGVWDGTEPVHDLLLFAAKKKQPCPSEASEAGVGGKPPAECISSRCALQRSPERNKLLIDARVDSSNSISFRADFPAVLAKMHPPSSWYKSITWSGKQGRKLSDIKG